MLRTPATLYTALYIGQFLFLGVQLPFFPGWLEAQGITAGMIGLVMGGALILRLVLGPVIAWWAENQPDQRTALMAVSAIMAISSLLLMLPQPVWSICVLTIFAVWAFGCLVPLSDTAVMRADKAGLVNYGQSRGAGSFAFIVANLLGGFLIAQHGDNVSVVWMGMTATLTLLVAYALPQRTVMLSGNDQVHTTVRPNITEAMRLFRSRSFILMLIAVGLTQGTHAAYYYFSELHWSALGYRSDLIGLLWTLGVLAEIIVLYKGRSFIRRLGPVAMISIGALGAVIRWPLTGLSPPLPLLIILQLLHALTFAMTYLGSVEFISRAVPSGLSNTGMTLVSTLGVGALTGLAAIFVGFVFNADAPLPAYLLMGGMGAVGFVAGLLLARRWDGGIIRTARA
ncbi:MFS transporter [Parvularcula sp. IMCC14364]|uniref:MFS transporter n=1 Tax=Parvularcula sp. IMCC14364 TaxID=3067902 RepID=UPI002741A290|nr:MFS transporter [Parvularcula sp. IMCC14364]